MGRNLSTVSAIQEIQISNSSYCVKFLKSATTRVNDIRQTFFPHQIGMLGSLEQPITLASRFCCQAKFIASATVRRAFAHILVVAEGVGVALVGG